MSVTQKKSINTINTINTINEIEDISENESEYDTNDISGVIDNIGKKQFINKKKDDKHNEKHNANNKSSSKINEELYNIILLDEYIYLRPTDLNFKIDAIILSKLKTKVEGKCVKGGYIMPNSVNIKTRSLGMINNASFDGMTTYKVTFTCEICNPVIGQVIQCTVGNIDKSQVICYIDTPNISPIEIYLFKHHHIGNTEYASLKNGDIIFAKIGGSKWEYKDTQINSIAQFVSVV